MLRIKSIPISYLTKIYEAFDVNFFKELINKYPYIGKENDTNFIINTSLGINNTYNLQHIGIFNTFVSIASNHCEAIHLIKNQ